MLKDEELVTIRGTELGDKESANRAAIAPQRAWGCSLHRAVISELTGERTDSR